jgi:thymidylate kinase
MSGAHQVTAADGPQPHPLLGAVFGALVDRGVRWCVLRGADELGSPSDGDVDLLVHPADLAAFKAATAQLGFAEIPSWGYGSHTFHLAYDVAGDTWIKLDVVTELAFGRRFELLARGAAASVLARCRTAGDVRVPALEDAFWCLLLHKLLDKGSVPVEVRSELQYLAAAGCLDSPLAWVVDGVGTADVGAERMVALVRAGLWEKLDELGPALADAWEQGDRIATLRRRLCQRFWRRMAKLLRRVRRQGLTVALLGPDGAGKSSAAAAVRDGFFFAGEIVYMGPGQPRHGRALPAGLGFAARVAAQLRRWARARALQSRGRLVLFDRYSFDALLPARRRLSRLSRWRRALLGRACPPPSLTVILDAPGELLYARKGEQSAAILEAERQAYLALASRLRCATVVDATQPPDAVRRAVTAAIWERWRRRWTPQ